MQFNHDNITGAWLAEELVNLMEQDRRKASDVESLLERFLFSGLSLGASDVRDLEDWARQLRTAFEGPDVEQRCNAVNRLLDRGVRRVYLSSHDGMRPHMHFADAGESVVDRVRAMTAGGLAVFLSEAGGHRMGACAESNCRRVFVDTSRAGRRAYCSARCGNKDAVQRYRDRTSQRKASPPSPTLNR
ncbi:CGNR zinc finger domain-containing protein [Arthrobacter sp. JZ12]|uniref:CGNR zinc finger domain-containing protein n=1 Tax=Arthrobacter sp. JZ12 TaxID=2654190 RepID=UPI002B4A9361|nr:CGNR zinc finger domain-containing protein [Arthrobacter sp. JZ12]WRH25995.1 CGNR zinc finger domain-containing protein [Arthrobacter sp. JZ12]